MFRIFQKRGFSSRFNTGKTTLMHPEDYYFKMYLSDLEEKGTEFYASSSLQLNGIEYKPGMYLVLGYDDHEYLLNFGRIEQIFFQNEHNIHFLCIKSYTHYFENKLHSYKIDDTSKNSLVSIHGHTMPSGEKYLMLRHAL